MNSLRVKLIATLIIGSSQLHAAPITQGAPGAVPPESFQIMSEREIAEHKAVMASLQGTAREEYRNAQYEKLKERAQAQGYLLPDTPPWGHTEVVPAKVEQPQAAETAPVQQAGNMMRELIEQQKQVVQEAMQAGMEMANPAPAEQQTASAAPASPQPAPQAAAPVAPPAGAVEAATPTAAAPAIAETSPPAQAKPAAPTPAPSAPPVATAPLAEAASPESSQAMEGYRSQMRDRFDQFMQQREERAKEREAKREQERANLAERRQQYQEQLERRRQAYRDRLQQQRQPAQAMPQPPAYGYPQPAYPVPQMPYTYPAQPMPYPPRY